jgi:hypothetical protein
MKKVFLPLVISLAILVLTGCEKKGTISGTVLDPFTGKAVEMPTVWMDSTIFSTQKAKYEFTPDLQQGKFKFVDVPVGDYLIKARRSKYVLGQRKVTTTEKNPNIEVTLYVYSDQINPGLYQVKDSVQKISNEWVIFSATCKESVAAYRRSYTEDLNASRVPDAKKKKAPKELKVNKLPNPRLVDASFSVLYCNQSSVTTPIEASSYPAVSGSVSSHADCSGFSPDEKDGIFANTEKETKLTVTYKAEGLFEISGTLPKGRQIIRLFQEGKTLQTYYFEVK